MYLRDGTEVLGFWDGEFLVPGNLQSCNLVNLQFCKLGNFGNLVIKNRN
jgi:hypothetical protein